MAHAAGGTAKPPKGAVSPWVVPTLPDPAFSVAPSLLHGFDDTGLIQSATVSGAACPTIADPNLFGGTVTLNGAQVVIPCNLIVQMPANTLTWAAFVNGSNGASANGPLALTGLELRTVGNMVGAQHIAALAYASQQSTNTHNGVITGFDYANGIINVADNNGGTDRVQLNDPKLTDALGNQSGRFSAGQSPDPRFSVDQDNPTVHAATGYPMCIPRVDPAVANDPLCPQINRPLAPPVPNPAPAIPSCRNFSFFGVVPPRLGDLGPPAAGQKYCSQYMMPTTALRTATEPDASQQAPFEIGDYITFAGTKFTDNLGDYISAHTVEANVGIYTRPGSQPAYTAIGDFGVGTADPLAVAVNGVTQETQNRIFLEAETTDNKTPVDIYYQDAPGNGGLPATAPGTRNRWTTPFEMTGENATPLAGPTGGISTQTIGAQPQRARLRAVKAPVGLLSQPSRTVRVAQRTLCLPTPVDPTLTTINQTALDTCFANAPKVANGLQAGQYVAPTFTFIFPENVKPGDLTVPHDLWHLPFLVNGDGTNGTGKLIPSPW